MGTGFYPVPINIQSEVLILKKIITILFFLSLILSGCINSTVLKNNKLFNNAVKNITTDEITLNDITNFQWDKAYTFLPYTTKEKMEEIIGIQSNEITETVNENMIQLFFIKGDIVICSICAYSETLGYNIFFGDYEGEYLMINYDDFALFSVQSIEGKNILTYSR